VSGAAGAVIEAELVHDPVRLDTVRGAALVEHQRLTHADERVQLGVDGLVAPRRLPESLRRGTVGAVACGVLPVLPTKEVVVRLLLVRVRLDLAQLCPFPTQHTHLNIHNCI